MNKAITLRILLSLACSFSIANISAESPAKVKTSLTSGELEAIKTFLRTLNKGKQSSLDTSIKTKLEKLDKGQFKAELFELITKGTKLTNPSMLTARFLRNHNTPLAQLGVKI